MPPTPHKVAGLAGLAVVAVLAGCGTDEPAGSATDQPSATSASMVLPQADEPVELDPAEFTADVTNPLFPLEPGTRWTYAETTEGGQLVEVVVTATAGTRELANGVTARIVRDTVTLDGEIIEDTFDWYAQHDDGTVWYLGEDTAEFEGGEITTRAGSFEAGVDDAEAGVIMPSTPEVGMTYRQEYYAGEAEDRGEVLGLDEQAVVPAGEYDGLVQTADTTPLDPAVLEHKHYARGTGLVLTLDLESGGREELLSVSRISPAEADRAWQAPLGEAY